MKQLITLVAVALMAMPVLAQDQAPKPDTDTNARIEALMARLAELEAEVARLRGEQAPKAAEAPREASEEPTLESLETPAPEIGDEKGIGFRCEACGGSFFLSADARGEIAELGDWVVCPACGAGCWVKTAGVPQAEAKGHIGRILFGEDRQPRCDRSKG